MIKNYGDIDYNYIVSINLLEDLIKADNSLIKISNQLEMEREIHKDLLHDVRKLDGLVKNKSEEIIDIYSNEVKLYDLLQKVRNIQAMEELISCKYSVYDLVSNISVLNLGNTSNICVYKKFDKVRYILKGYKKSKPYIF